MTNGLSAMGFGLPPAAIAAQARRCRDRPVVALIGDGGFAMTATELRLAAARGLGMAVVVFVDGSLNRIELKQAALGYPSTATRLDEHRPRRARRARWAVMGPGRDSAAELEKAVAMPDRPDPATGHRGAHRSRPVRGPILITGARRDRLRLPFGLRGRTRPAPAAGGRARGGARGGGLVRARCTPGSDAAPHVPRGRAARPHRRRPPWCPDRPACRWTAALINGTAAHTAELDDIYREGALSPGPQRSRPRWRSPSMRAARTCDFLRAVTSGFEIGAGSLAVVNPAHYRYWHPTGTVGAIGAAAAAAEILGQLATELAHALAIATTMAAGGCSRRSDPGRWAAVARRACGRGGARWPPSSARAAYRALTSRRYGRVRRRDVGRAGTGLRRSRASARSSCWPLPRVMVKNHACCGSHTFAAVVDAALELRARGVDPAAIEAITVGEMKNSRRDVGGRGSPDPGTDFEAKFSTQYCVAGRVADRLGPAARVFEESGANPRGRPGP